MPDIHELGSITFWLRHEHTDWFENQNRYNFGSVSNGGIQATAIKHPDKTIQIDITGAMNQDFTFHTPAPHCGPEGMHVAITWGNLEIKLYLNGALVQARTTGDP